MDPVMQPFQGPAFNYAFTVDTKDEAIRRNEKNFINAKESRAAGGINEEMGFTRAVADAVNDAIKAMPETTYSFNVEVSGPSPMLISVSQGPR